MGRVEWGWITAGDARPQYWYDGTSSSCWNFWSTYGSFNLNNFAAVI